MDQIKEITYNGAFAVALSGHITSANAAQVEAALMALIEGRSDKELVLDAENLEYISSAGLRVLLGAQKKMLKIGSMKVINVCEEVMEVFEMTGFADILVIE